MKKEDKATRTFNLIAGIILFILGCALEVNNLFVEDIANGYQLVFGLELIAGGVFLVQGKFKGFSK